MLQENNPSHLDIFRDCLIDSLQAIDERYYLVPRYQTTPAQRERAFCYELFHQLRNCLGDEFPFTLHGEIDKRGHDFISRFFGDDPNPDFILHMPGTMNNLAVIEVKVSDCRRLHAQEDIDKLVIFVESIGYVAGIFLLFGPSDPHHMVDQLTIQNQHVAILWQPQPGEAPVWLRPLNPVGEQNAH
jgi:hypothetical protein